MNEVFWKIHKERRKRERDLEFKPGCTLRPPLVISDQKRQEMVSQAFVQMPDADPLAHPQIISRSCQFSKDTDSEYYQSQQLRTDSSLNQRALEMQRVHADKFWNGRERFKDLKRNEWETIDFYDQQLRLSELPAQEPSIRSHNSLTRRSSIPSQSVSGAQTPSPTKKAR